MTDSHVTASAQTDSLDLSTKFSLIVIEMHALALFYQDPSGFTVTPPTQLVFTRKIASHTEDFGRIASELTLQQGHEAVERANRFIAKDHARIRKIAALVATTGTMSDRYIADFISETTD